MEIKISYSQNSDTCLTEQLQKEKKQQVFSSLSCLKSFSFYTTQTPLVLTIIWKKCGLEKLL